jgi:hypothetical protein
MFHFPIPRPRPRPILPIPYRPFPRGPVPGRGGYPRVPYRPVQRWYPHW